MLWMFPDGEQCDAARGNQVVALIDGEVVGTEDTIGKALEDVGHCGDDRVVVVCPGTYHEAIEVYSTKDLDLEIVAPGGPAATVIDADGWGDQAIRLSEQWWGGGVGDLDLQITGLGVTGGYTGAVPAGIRSWRESSSIHLVLDGVKVYGNGNGVVLDGFYASSTSSLQVLDSEILGNLGQGIQFLDSDTDAQLVLTGSWIHGNAGRGVRSWHDVVGGLVESNLGGGVEADRLVGTVVRYNSAVSGAGVEAEHFEVTLEDCWIEGNIASGAGGGVSAFGTVNLVGNTVIIGNQADIGGGIDANGVIGDGAQVVMENSARLGGGLHVSMPGLFEPAEVTGVWVGWNFATEGGGMYVDGFADVSGSTFLSNAAKSAGGGIAVPGDFSALILTDTVISGNTAAEGGGLEVAGLLTAVDASDVTLSGNTAGLGGGLLVTGGEEHAGPEVDLRGGSVVANQGAGAALVGTGFTLTAEGTYWGKPGSDDDNTAVDIDLNGVGYDGDLGGDLACGVKSCLPVFPLAQ